MPDPVYRVTLPSGGTTERALTQEQVSRVRASGGTAEAPEAPAPIRQFPQRSEALPMRQEGDAPIRQFSGNVMPQLPPQMSGGEAFGRGAAETASFGFDDEMGGVGAAAAALLDDDGRPPAERAMRAYAGQRDQNREASARGSLQQPEMHLAGNLVGGAGTAALPMGRAAQGGRIAQRALAAAKGGGAAGAVGGAGTSEADPLSMQMARDVGGGAFLGAAVAPVAGEAIRAGLTGGRGAVQGVRGFVGRRAQQAQDHARRQAQQSMGPELADRAQVMGDPLSDEGARLRKLADQGASPERISEHQRVVEGELGDLQRTSEEVRNWANIGEKPKPILEAVERGGVHPTGPNEILPPAGHYTGPGAEDAYAAYAASSHPDQLQSLPLPPARPERSAPAPRAKNPKRVEAAQTAWARRNEADEMIAYEFEGDPAALEVWNKVKGRIKGDKRTSRLERFQEYLHDNPAEVSAAQQRLQDVSGAGESMDDFMARRDPADVRTDELEAHSLGQRPAQRNPPAEREAAESLGELAEDGGQRSLDIGPPEAPVDSRYGEIFESLEGLQGGQGTDVTPQMNAEWDNLANTTVSSIHRAADFLAPKGGRAPLPVPGAATTAKRLRDAVEIYEPQIREGLAAGGPEGGAQAFIGLDRLKRAIGRGLGSPHGDIRETALEVYEPLRESLERADLWGAPAAEIQRVTNKKYTAAITADKAGFDRKFLSPSPTERTSDNLRNLELPDSQKIGSLVNEAGSDGSRSSMELLNAGTETRSDLTQSLAQHYGAPDDLMAKAARSGQAAGNIRSTMGARTAEAGAAADVAAMGAASRPPQGLARRLVGRVPKVGDVLDELSPSPGQRAAREATDLGSLERGEFEGNEGAIRQMGERRRMASRQQDLRNQAHQPELAVSDAKRGTAAAAGGTAALLAGQAQATEASTVYQVTLPSGNVTERSLTQDQAARVRAAGGTVGASAASAPRSPMEALAQSGRQ